MDEYSSSFTIHGLSRIIETNSQMERLFWTIMLASSIAAAFVMGQSLILNFWKKAVYVSNKQIVTNNNTFPSVTFCLWPIAERQMYCNWKANDVIPGVIAPTVLSCNKDGWWDEMNWMFSKNYLSFHYAVGSLELFTTPAKTFVVSCPRASDECLQSYLKKELFRPLNGSNQCLTWNYNGYFSNSKNKIELKLKVESLLVENVFIYIHDHRESPRSTERYFPLNSNSDTQIILKKSVREKVKSHLPNDCEDVYYNNKKNMFPGRYTLEACMDTFTCIQSLIKCGEVLDFCRFYIPADLREKYWIANQTMVDVNSCMFRGFDEGLFYANGSECLMPCEKEFYSVSFVSTPGSMKITLLFEERNVYEYTKESFVYVWQDVIAGVGGLIGLFCGLSVLSIFEILTYFGLWLVSFFVSTNRNSKCETSNELRDIAGSATNYAVNS